MQSNRINRLIIRLIDNTITDEESMVLTEWLKEAKNQDYFNKFIAANQLISERKKFEPKKSYLELLFKKTPRRRKTKTFYFAAAAILILVLTFYWFQPAPQVIHETTNNTPLIVNNQIQTGSNKAILTLSNGTKIILGKKTNYRTPFVKTDSASISYAANDKVTSNHTTYNTLTIPRGGQFTIELSDGSTVWLNSESEIRFPVSFQKGKLRNVELMYGEAYFSVSPSTKNGGSKFMVHQGKQTIEVLGTQFNVKAYKGDKSIITTLVEGKIAIHYNTNEKIMMPNEQAISDIQKGSLKIKNIDVKPEVSWKEGEFSFKEESLKNIMQVLSRWYDMEVVFENKSLEEVKFKGVLRKNLKIEEIMSIMMTTSINNYEINNHKIILK
ncbi:FecR family protein [Flavobacterium flavipallidum]|uniref:FecR family protein n=1 Tax=Flavobacterium flavipallidum TaxID=3139140 RepID=A0ABU9HHT3_9FLAO